MATDEQQASMEELFGDISDDEQPSQSKDAAGDAGAGAGSDSVDESQRQQLAELFGEDEEVKEPAKEGSQAESFETKEERPTAGGKPVSFATQKQMPFPEGAQLLLAKLPNVVSIEPKPFDPDTFTMEEPRTVQQQPDDDGVGAPRKVLRLTSGNVIRWRAATDASGNKVRETNARIARWPDGRTTLHLGAEVFEVQEDVYSEEASSFRSVLYSQLQGVPVRKSMGSLVGAIKFRPTTMDSESHHKLKNLISDTHVKMPKIRRTHDTADPEKAKAEREKLAREQEAAESRKRKKQERTQRRTTQPFNRSFLEDDEDEAEAMHSSGGSKARIDEAGEEDASARALNAKRGGGGGRRRERKSDAAADEDNDAALDAADALDAEEADTGDDSEGGSAGSEDDKRKKKKKKKKHSKKRKREEAADEEVPADDAVPAVDDDEGPVVKRPTKKAKKKLADDDDDGSGSGSS